MLAVVAVALWTGRMNSASVVLCAALFVVLAIDPWAVLAPGFWLSFGAVAVIMFVTTSRIAQEHWFAAWARVQWAITLALIPLLLAMFQQISLVSPLANAIAIPVVSFVVVPLTLVGVALPFDLVLQLAHAVMGACGAMLEWMSALPLAVWQQHAPPPWTVVIAMMAIVWMLMPRGFPARWIGVAGLLPLFLVEPAALAERTVKLTVLDVGQGLAVVVQTRHHALLYDAGPAYGPQIDSGNRIIVPYFACERCARPDRHDRHSRRQRSQRRRQFGGAGHGAAMAADVDGRGSSGDCAGGVRGPLRSGRALAMGRRGLRAAASRAGQLRARKISRQRSQLRAENNGG